MATRKYLKELPPSRSGQYERPPNPEHAKMVKALRRKPGQWVAVRDFQTPQAASAFARKIRESTFIAFRDGVYEANSREMTVYARFVSDL